MLGRRQFLRLGAAGGAAALLGTAAGCAVETPWTGTLHMLTWDFQPDTIRKLVADWSADGHLPTDVAVLPSLGYSAALQTRLRGGDIPHVYYNYAYNSQKFVEEDWAADLTGQPGVDTLIDDLYPSARERHVRADGAVISVPYFSALHMLHYNERLVAEAGFDGPPTSLAQTYEQCETLKKNGQDTPYVAYWVKEFCEEFFIRYLINDGVVPFDGNGAPVFKDDPRAIEVMAWWQAMYREGLTPKSLLTDDPGKTAGMMAQGTATFFALHHYFLSTVRALKGPEAAHVKMTIGAEQTLQIGEVLQMGSVSSAEARAGSWELMQYYGWKDAAGKYSVSAQWAKAAGLAAPYPGFFRDPEVIAAYPDYYDLSLLDRTFAKGSQVVPTRCASWYPGFQAKVGDLVHGMLLGESDPAGTVAALADAAVATQKAGGL